MGVNGASIPGEAYLPRQHRERARRLRDLHLLYSGDHETYYVAEKNSCYKFRPLKSGEKPFFSPFDLLGLISRKTADLLFGEAPRIKSGDETVQRAIAGLVEDSSLHAVILSAAIECSWAGESFLEIVQEAGRTLVMSVPVREIFPLGPIGADGQVRAYIRYATEQIDVNRQGQPVQPGEKAERQMRLLLETSYEPGRIVNQCWEISKEGAKVGEETKPLSWWPVKDADGGDLKEEVRTGIKAASIVRLRNDAAGESDYTRQLVALQDTLNAKQTQLARVIMKHADPKMYFATGTAGDDGNVRAEDDAIFGDTPEAMPRYITWEAQLNAAIEDRRFALLALATVAEMPLSVLGVKDDSTAESAAKMRLSAINAIAKAQRKSAYHVAAIRLVIARALEAEGLRVPAGAIIIQTRDGIPDDETERANVIATLRGAGAISLRRALQMQQLDEPEVKAELAELAQEQKQKIPPIFGEIGELPDERTETEA